MASSEKPYISSSHLADHVTPHSIKSHGGYAGITPCSLLYIVTAAVVCADDVCVIYSLLTALTNTRETRHAEANMVA